MNCWVDLKVTCLATKATVCSVGGTRAGALSCSTTWPIPPRELSSYCIGKGKLLQGRQQLGKGQPAHLLTSDLKEASSSEFESSACWVRLASRDSLSAFPLSPLLLLLSLATFLSGKEEEVRGEVPGARRVPFDPLFLGFLALGFGESVAAGRLLEALGRVGGWGAPLGDRLSSFVSFRAILGSLKAALGAGAFSSLGSLRTASLALLGSRSGSLEQLLLSESLRGRSRCSLATLCGLDALPLSLLASCKAKGRKVRKPC